jgi:hypothetical protein
VQVAAPTPQAAGRLFAVGPDVAKFLAVVAMRLSTLDVEVNLRPTVSRQVCLEVGPLLGQMTDFNFFE